MIPIAGSAYTYSYATMGELVAWIIGWDLILEYMVASAAVSVGWSGYAVAFVHDVLGITLPKTWTSAPFVYDEVARQFHATGAVLNIPAMLITALVTVVLVIGIKESARFNSVIVTVKVAVVLMFIAFCARYVHPEYWHPFIPKEEAPGRFGVSGVMRGAARVFFAYIGFDAVSTAAQETRNPQRDLPRGILGSLAVCTVLYVAVSLVLTGLVPYQQLGVPHPIALGVEATGQRLAGDAGRDRRHRRPVVGDAGDDDGAAAHLLFDGARRVASAGRGPRSPALRHAHGSRPSSRASRWRWRGASCRSACSAN